jgi:hypothetical protein
MVSGCPILSRYSFAKLAAKGAPTSGRISNGKEMPAARRFPMPQIASQQKAPEDVGA